MTKELMKHLADRKRAGEIITEFSDYEVDLVTALFEAQLHTFANDPDVENLTSEEYRLKWDHYKQCIQQFVEDVYHMDRNSFRKLWWACDVLATETAMAYA